MDIKEARIDDVVVIADLAKTIWEQHFTPIIGAEQVAYMLDTFQSVAAITAQLKEGYIYYLMYEGSKPIGYSAILYSEERSFLSKIYILVEARGKGYASKCMNFMEQTARAMHSKAIWLTCNKYNEQTLAQYFTLGFNVFDSVVKEIGNGYVMDDYYLEKIL